MKNPCEVTGENSRIKQLGCQEKQKRKNRKGGKGGSQRRKFRDAARIMSVPFEMLLTFSTGFDNKRIQNVMRRPT
jgi:hypothetical protein